MKSRPSKEKPRPSPPQAVPAPLSASPDSIWRRHGLIVAALCGLILAANINSFQAGFPFDNRAAIVMDARIRAATPENIHALLTQDYWPKQISGLYRPLTSLSYLFNYVTLGNEQNPAGYHWFNLLLHMINAGLVYFLGLLLFQRRFWAAAMAGVWCVHPLLTESVVNIVGRADLLAALAVLGGLACYVRQASAKGNARIAWLAGAAAVTAIGMFSKESAIVVLGVIFLYDLTFPDRTRGHRLPGYLAIGAACAVYLAVRFSVFAGQSPVLFPYPDNPLVGASFLTARLTAFKVLGKYLWLLLWPAKLSCDYSYNQIPLFAWNFGAEDLKAIAGLLVCLALAAWAILSYRRNKIVFFCIAFFFGVLAPTSNLLNFAGTIMAERFLYLPVIGFAGLIVLGVREVSGRLPAANRRNAALAVFGILCAAYAARTYIRNFDWYSDETLYAANLASCPNSFKSHNGLAVAWTLDKPPQLDKAVVEMDRSIQILDTLPDDKSTSVPYSLAGYTYRLKGDSLAPAPESRQWFQKSVDVLTHAARIDEATGRAKIEAAAEHGIRLMRTGWPPLYLELGKSYLRLLQPGKALEALKFGASVSPDPEFFEEMANAYYNLGNPGQAPVALLEGLTMNPKTTRFIGELVNVYRKIAPGSCALDAAGSLNLNCPLVHENVCQASREAAGLYNELGKPAVASETFNAAVTKFGCR